MGSTVSCSNDDNIASLNHAYVSIPDSSFEAILIKTGVDSDGIINQQMLSSDAEGITTLDLSNLEYEAYPCLLSVSSL
ncbi:hypothetical protein JM81_1065 [Maribacter sp. MAR_2009_72]|nr:hypothetical protein JM81_1065 [Maribacter sp. MAR_2009_72]